MFKRLVVALSSAAMFITACGVEDPALDPSLEAPGDPVEKKNEELIFSDCVGGTGSFTSSSGPFAAHASVVVVGTSNADAWAQGTFTPRPGTTRSTVSVAPTFDADIGIQMPPGWGQFGSTMVVTSLIVSNAAGATLCTRSVTVLSRSTPIGAITDYRTLQSYPMSCTFEHDTSGGPVNVRVSLSTNAAVGAIPGVTGVGGSAWANASGSVGTFSHTQCETQLGWCTHDGARLLALDSNGDRRTDHVCVTSPSGFMHVNTTPATGIPDDTVDYDVIGFCPSPQRLITGDVNGDGKDDLVCIDQSTRRLRIDLADANGLFSGAADVISNSVGAMSCAGAVLADFNGDGRDDLQCNAGSGRVNIDYSDGTGMFPAAEFEPPTFCAGASLRIADFNADNRADHLCFNPTTGLIQARFADGAGRFGALAFDSGTRGWCFHSGARLTLADANGDRRADLLCSTSGTGWVHADFANASGPLFDGFNERSADKDFCTETNGLFVTVDYTGLGRQGLVCQVPAAPPSVPFGSNTLQQSL